jgi:uncharacterized membrane protein YoaT (DUF817 family)
VFKTYLSEFLWFGLQQARACIFGGLLLGLIVFTHFFWPQDIALSRYDFLFLGAIFIQLVLILSGMETWDEAKVIFIFHVVGTIMELFKTSVGSWSYPEQALIKIGHVPLFSGFMYATVGSYIARITRIFDMRYTFYPSKLSTIILAFAVYINFFTHHYIPDIRGLLFLMVGVIFSSTYVYFKPHKKEYKMPLLVGFILVTMFICFAENIGTFASVWVYPSQKTTWQMVSYAKIGSWFLLMIISFVLVTLVHPPALPDENKKA